MPIEIHWANNTQSIVIQKFYDVWTWEQVGISCRTELYPAIMELSHPIVLIQDMVGSHWTPTTNLLQEVEKLMGISSPENLRMILVVSGEVSVDTLVVSAYKRYGQPHQAFQSAKTINAAIRVASDFLS